jgi:iron(III) transport system permease protein
MRDAGATAGSGRQAPDNQAVQDRPAQRPLRRPPVVLAGAASIVALLMLLPVAYLALRAREAEEGVWSLVFRARTFEILLNTVWLAGAVALTTVVIAVPLAWLTVRSDLPGRRLVATMATMPLVIPSYVGAWALIGAFGPKGLLQQGMEGPFGIERLPEIYGFFGAWLALSLFTYPYVFLATRASLRGLDPSLEEAARGLGYGPWRTFLTATLPRLRPAMAAGGLLAALYTVSDFGVVALMRYDAFTRAIYVQYRAAFDRTYAATLALLLIVLALALLAIERRARGRAVQYRLGTGAARRSNPVALGWWRWPALLFCAGVVALALVVPLAVLVYWLTTGLSGGEAWQGIWSPALNSAGVSALAAVVTMAAALPGATLSARYGGRWVRGIEALDYLGYALPGIVIGLAFVFIGANYLPSLYQTMPLMVIAYLVRFLPQAVAAAATTLGQVSPRLEEAARMLGRSPLGAIRDVTAPLAWPGIAGGMALVFLTVMKELPITLVLRPTGFETLATEIWAATGTGSFAKAAGPSLVLVALSVAPTVLLVTRDRRASAGPPVAGAAVAEER